MRFSPLNFGFGSGDAGATPNDPRLMTADLSKTGRDWNIIPQGVTPGPEIDQNVPAPAPGTPWSPSFMEHLQSFLIHPGTWGETGDRLSAEHGAALFARRLAQERDAAGTGMAPGARFALDADPASYATSMNENYKPRVVGAGDTAMGFGRSIGMAPKAGVTPQGVGYAQDADKTVQTGQLATPMTAAEAAAAADAEAKTGLARLKTPAEIYQAYATGKAALLNAQKSGASSGGQYSQFLGNLKPGAAPGGR